jgi:hypothetical protein
LTVAALLALLRLSACSSGEEGEIVIGSGKPNPAFGEHAEALQQFWIEQNRAVAPKSTNGA